MMVSVVHRDLLDVLVVDLLRCQLYHHRPAVDLMKEPRSELLVHTMEDSEQTARQIWIEQIAHEWTILPFGSSLSLAQIVGQANVLE